jgi:hypothetical protein
MPICTRSPHPPQATGRQTQRPPVCPAQVDDGLRWTGKYLRNNGRLREVVATLLELAHLPPHEALHGGRTCISISAECGHDKVAALLGGAGEYLRGKHQVRGPTGSSWGWRPASHWRSPVASPPAACGPAGSR